MHNLLGIVVCGGRSRRMGTPKHRLPFGNHTMLEHVLQLLGSVTDSTIIVASSNQDFDFSSTPRVVRDRNADCGPLEAIATGLESAEQIAERAFITACDVPLLNPRFVERLCDLLDDNEIVAD